MICRPSTGVITYTGPSASEVRAHFSVGGDIAYNSSTGVISFTDSDSSYATLVRSKLSAGSGISYNNSTGVFTYTPPNLQK